MTTSKPSRAARAAFLLLHIEGLSVCVDGDQLLVKPRCKITPELRTLIRAHRDELVRLTVEGADGFDPRQFPETTAVLATFRRVFGPGCRLKLASEQGHVFGEPAAPGVQLSEHPLHRGRR